MYYLSCNSRCTLPICYREQRYVYQHETEITGQLLFCKQVVYLVKWMFLYDVPHKAKENGNFYPVFGQPKSLPIERKLLHPFQNDRVGMVWRGMVFPSCSIKKSVRLCTSTKAFYINQHIKKSTSSMWIFHPSHTIRATLKKAKERKNNNYLKWLCCSVQRQSWCTISFL